jgi:hypothetical protein
MSWWSNGSASKDPRIKDTMNQTGIIGNHWASLQTPLEKAGGTIASLQDTIAEINKPSLHSIRLVSTSD